MHISTTLPFVVSRILHLAESRAGHVVRQLPVRDLGQVRHQAGSAVHTDDDSAQSRHGLRFLQSPGPDQARQEASAVAHVAVAQSRLLLTENEHVDAVKCELPDGGRWLTGESFRADDSRRDPSIREQTSNTSESSFDTAVPCTSGFVESFEIL